jgi:predicted MFS family arabinose efflux permease
MLLQMAFVALMMILVGSLTCLAVATDPNSIPNPKRRRLLPIGLALLLAGIGAFCFMIGLDYVGDALDSYVGMRISGGLLFLGGYGLAGICGGILGFRIGKARNRRLNYR